MKTKNKKTKKQPAKVRLQDAFRRSLRRMKAYPDTLHVRTVAANLELNGQTHQVQVLVTRESNNFFDISKAGPDAPFLD